MDRAYLLCLIAAVACRQPSSDARADPSDASLEIGSNATAVELETDPPVVANNVTIAPEQSPKPPVEVRIENGMAFIPAATMLAGSAPGTAFRDARSEADLVPVELESYWIDLRPADARNVDRNAATETCEADGKRLCSELEWEYACAGPERHPYAGGERFDPESTSVFGVHGLGSLGEWTLSPPVRDVAGNAEVGAVFRGARTDADAPRHRCAARRGTSATTESRHIGFRCCRSADTDAPTPDYPDERIVGRFLDLELSEARIREVLASVPGTAPHADRFVPIRLEDARASIGASEPEGLEEMDEEAARTARRTPPSLFGWEIAPASLRWSPTPGDTLWVLSGRLESTEAGGEARSAVYVLYPMPDDTLRLATSIVLEAGAGDIALAYTPSERTFIKWSARWGTSAEGGVLKLDEDRRVSFEVR